MIGSNIGVIQGQSPLYNGWGLKVDIENQQDNKMKVIMKKLLMTCQSILSLEFVFFIATCILLSCGNKKSNPSDNTKNDVTPVAYYEQGYFDGSDGTGGILVMKSFEEIKELSEKGDKKAQYSLGMCYKEGQHVTQSISKALEWFRKSAEQGFAMAQLELGLCYYEGNGVEQSYKEAVKWYRQSAEQGYSYGEHCLGVCYERGEGVPQSDTEAAKWYLSAAKKGNMYSMYNLALFYENNGDTSKAFEIFMELANKGVPDAQCNVADYYRQGVGVEKNMKEAIKWYKQAASNGSERAVGWLNEIGENN